MALGAEAAIEERLQQIEAFGVEGRWTEVEQGIARIESELDAASVDQRTRLEIVRARMQAVTNQPEASIETVLGILQQRELLDPVLEMRVLTLATNVLVFHERYEEGFGYFREALELAPLIPDPDARAVAWIVAADFHGRVGESATAIQYADRVLEETDESASRQRCAALYQRALARRNFDELSGARSDFSDAVAICSQARDPIYIGLARLGLAQTRLAAGAERDAVRQGLLAAIEDHRGIGFIEGLLQTSVELARLAIEDRRLGEAAEHLAPTEAWIDLPGSHSTRAETLYLKAELARLNGQTEDAYRFMQRGVDEEMKHAQSMRQMRVTLLLSDLDERARQQELDLLRARNDAIRLAGRNERQDEIATLWAVAGILATAVLLGIVLVQTARDRRRFRELARLDGWTGLVNHTRFFELALQGFVRARQNRGHFVLIIADIDLFKRINDEHGHLVGDAVLRRVGARFLEAFGKDAVIGRLGGEEIGVALGGVDLDAALARIEHLRAILNRRRADDTEPEITMSFGVAELGRERSLDTLYAHADQALYDAKDAGRNRVVTISRIQLDSGAAFVT